MAYRIHICGLLESDENLSFTCNFPSNRENARAKSKNTIAKYWCSILPIGDSPAVISSIEKDFLSGNLSETHRTLGCNHAHSSSCSERKSSSRVERSFRIRFWPFGENSRSGRETPRNAAVKDSGKRPRGRSTGVRSPTSASSDLVGGRSRHSPRLSLDRRHAPGRRRRPVRRRGRRCSVPGHVLVWVAYPSEGIDG